MSISEQQRHDVFKWFEEAMGPERAASMMSLLPPVGWADVATKDDLLALRHDLLALEQRLDARFAAVDARFAAVDANFTSVDANFTSVDARFTTLEAGLRLELAEGLNRQTKLFVGWLLGGLGTILTANLGAMALLV